MVAFLSLFYQFLLTISLQVVKPFIFPSSYRDASGLGQQGKSKKRGWEGSVEGTAGTRWLGEGHHTVRDLSVMTTITETSLNLTKAIKSYIPGCI